MPSKLIEKRNELKAKQDKLHEILKQMGDDFDLSKVTLLQGDNAAKAATIKGMNKELADLGIECDSLVEIEKAYTDDQTRQTEAEEAARKGLPQPRKSDGEGERKDVGKLVVENPQFKEYRGGKIQVPVDIDLKTLMSTSAGFAPQSIRTGEVVPYVRRPPSVLDLVNIRATSQAAIVYMEQTTRTNNAAERTEGSGAMGEAALAYTERSVTVQEVATFIPVTSQQLEDIPQVEGIINDELGQMLRERIDSQMINGTGATIYLAGWLALTGIQTRGFAGDYFDTAYNALKDIRVTGRSVPSAFIFHPNDWAMIRLARTEEGLYILGNPNEVVERLWGLQVVQTDAIAEKTSLAGAFADWTRLYEKRGVVVEITDSHDTYFIYGKYAIRATTRVALVTSRPAAFCKITRP